MELDPTARVVVEYVLVGRVTVPRVDEPFLKVIVPVAVEGATVAVKVTELPETEGLAEEVSPVVVAAILTDWVSAGEVLVP